MPPRFLPRLTDERAKALMPASTALGSSTAGTFETAKPGTVPWAMPGMTQLAARIDDKPHESGFFLICNYNTSSDMYLQGSFTGDGAFQEYTSL